MTVAGRSGLVEGPIRSDRRAHSSPSASGVPLDVRVAAEAAGVGFKAWCRHKRWEPAAEMERFVSTFQNKIDAKGRVSIPAPFRAILERDGYSQSPGGGAGSGATGASGVYCYPSLDAPALDGGGERLAQKIDGLLRGLADYSDERDELSVALYGDVQILNIDGDGRIVLPEALRAHAGLAGLVTFVGLGDKFQMWEPGAFEARRTAAREKVQEHRKLFANRARSANPDQDGSDSGGGGR